MFILNLINDFLLNHLIVLEVATQNSQLAAMDLASVSSFSRLVDYIKQNQYLIIMTGMYIGNYFSRSFLYDYLMGRGMGLTIIQSANTLLFMIF